MPPSGRSSAGGKISLPSIIRDCEGAIGGRLRILPICVCVILWALGLVGGFALAGGVHTARAADDPVPTTPITAPEPAPDPAPTPAPAPKPKPKPAAPAPRQSVSQTRPTSVIPTSAPVTSSSPTTRPQTTKPEVKKRVVHKKAQGKKKVRAKPATSLPKIVKPKSPRSGVLGTRTAATVDTKNSFGFGALLIVALLGFAMVCFGVASIPAMYVPWRPVAYFIAYRHLDIAIAGLALLSLAACLVFLVGI
jgi:hypothetical protein